MSTSKTFQKEYELISELNTHQFFPISAKISVSEESSNKQQK